MYDPGHDGSMTPWCDVAGCPERACSYERGIPGHCLCRRHVEEALEAQRKHEEREKVVVQIEEDEDD